MDKELKARTVNNGYEISVKGEKTSTIYVFKNNEEIEMIERVAKWLTDKKMVVKER